MHKQNKLFAGENQDFHRNSAIARCEILTIPKTGNWPQNSPFDIFPCNGSMDIKCEAEIIVSW